MFVVQRTTVLVGDCVVGEHNRRVMPETLTDGNCSLDPEPFRRHRRAHAVQSHPIHLHSQNRTMNPELWTVLLSTTLQHHHLTVALDYVLQLDVDQNWLHWLKDVPEMKENEFGYFTLLPFMQLLEEMVVSQPGWFDCFLTLLFTHPLEKLIWGWHGIDMGLIWDWYWVDISKTLIYLVIQQSMDTHVDELEIYTRYIKNSSYLIKRDI